MGIAHCLLRGSRPRVLLGLSLLWVFCGLSGGPLAHAQAQPQTKVNPKDGLTYVLVNPGTFQMGCSPASKSVTGLGGAPVACVDSEKPVHQVTITKAFWMGQTQVTQAAYTKV